jgi:hypothetical protein
MKNKLTTTEKLSIMSKTIKPVINLLSTRLSKKNEAIKAYDTPIVDGDVEIQKMREIEAIKLRHEISVLIDLIDIVNAMYPDAQ